MRLTTIFLLFSVLDLISCKSDIISIENEQSLTDFPSSSSMEYYNDRIYLIGDDATKVLALDKDYKRIDSIKLFSGEGRIPKDKKPDFEASTFLSNGSNAALLLIGSGSTSVREKALELSINKRDTASYNTTEFFNRVSKAGIRDINIEGAATVKDKLILANRANAGNTDNMFIITEPNFYKSGSTAAITPAKVELPKTEQVVGISGLSYSLSNDILFFTASTEMTANAVEDGAIGDSYLGWIRNPLRKINLGNFKVDGFINLAKANNRFIRQKIEAVCIEKIEGNSIVLHLAADNDDGKSQLFKIRLKLKE